LYSFPTRRSSDLCASVRTEWHTEVFEMMKLFSCSHSWRVREGVALALQRLLPVMPNDTIDFLVELATKGNCFQQRASIAAIAEPPLLQAQAMIDAALAIQRIVLER